MNSEGTTMEVPKPLVDSCSGFSIDLGSSLMKIAYVPKGAGQARDKGSKVSHLQLITFKATEFDEAIDFLDKHCYIKTEGGSVPQVYAVGLRSRESVKKLESKLGVRHAPISSLQCLASGFTYLARNSLLPKYLMRGTVDPRTDVLSQNKKVEGLNPVAKHPFNYHLDAVNTLISKTPEEAYAASALLRNRHGCGFPCLLMVCGSGYCCLKVHASGNYELLDTASRGGVTFMGLASLYGGAKTFDELVEITQDGDSSQVDIQMLDILRSMTDNDDIYRSMSKGVDDEVIYSFGKAPGKTAADFKPGSITHALLKTVAMDLSMIAFNLAERASLSDVVMCGSLMNSQFVRDTVAEWFTRKKVQIVGFAGKGGDVNLHFLKQGSHLGALGALLSSVEPSPRTGPSEHESPKDVPEF